MRTAKTDRLGGCPGWSESSLAAKAILLVLSLGGSDNEWEQNSDKNHGSSRAITLLQIDENPNLDLVNIHVYSNSVENKPTMSSGLYVDDRQAYSKFDHNPPIFHKNDF